jgi:hypothetical protein
MPRQTHPQWQESHYDTKYPFADQVTLINDDGNFIPETLLLDAVLYPIGGGERLRLSKIVVTSAEATIYVGDETTEELASTSFELLNPPTELLLVDAYGRTAGVLVSEPTRLAVFQTWLPNTYLFETAQTEFAATCCIPTPQLGVWGIVLDDGTIFTDDVWIVGDDGVILEVDDTTRLNPPCVGVSNTLEAIKIHMTGDPLFKRAECGDLFQARQFLESITVEAGTCRVLCVPDARGDFKFTGGSNDASSPVLRVKNVPGRGLMIEAAGHKVGD